MRAFIEAKSNGVARLGRSLAVALGRAGAAVCSGQNGCWCCTGMTKTTPPMSSSNAIFKQLCDQPHLEASNFIPNFWNPTGSRERTNPGFCATILRQKYAGRTIDVVVASASPPLDFLLKYRSDLFPHTPDRLRRYRPSQRGAA